MKKIILLFPIVILFTCFKAYAQVTVDPALVSAVGISGYMQKQALDEIKNEQEAIKTTQSLITIGLKSIKDTEEKTLKYLSQVQDVIMNLQDVANITIISKNIIQNIDALQSAIRKNPKGLINLAIRQERITAITRDLVEIGVTLKQVALNPKALLNSAERVNLIANLKFKLSDINWAIIGVTYFIKAASLSDIPFMLFPDLMASSQTNLSLAKQTVASFKNLKDY